MGVPLLTICCTVFEEPDWKLPFALVNVATTLCVTAVNSVAVHVGTVPVDEMVTAGQSGVLGVVVVSE